MAKEVSSMASNSGSCLRNLSDVMDIREGKLPQVFLNTECSDHGM